MGQLIVLSTLSLLMLRILADDHYAAMPSDYLALLADFFNGWFNLHCVIPFLSKNRFLTLKFTRSCR